MQDVRPRAVVLAMMIVAIASLVMPGKCQAEAGAERPTVDIHVDLGSAPDEATVRLDFARKETTATQLLVVALNFNRADIGKGINPAPVGTFGQYLTGWFVAQQETQELWVGISLQAGQPRAPLTIALPGLLKQIQDYPAEYELLYSSGEPTLAQLAGGSGSVVYSEIRSFSVSTPQWGDILEKNSTGWHRASGQTYRLDPRRSVEEPSDLVFLVKEALVRTWVDKEAVKFLGGFGFMAVMLHLVPTRFRKLKRPVAAGAAIIFGVLLFHVGGWSRFNWKAMIFEGSVFAGAALVAAMYLILPVRYADALVVVVEKLTGRGKGADSVAAEPEDSGKTAGTDRRRPGHRRV